MIEVDSVSFRYKYANGWAMRDLSLNLAPGEMVGLIGPNGSGKSTLLKLSCGLLHPKEGEVRLQGVSLSHIPRRMVAQHIALVPQSFHIPFAFRVREIVMLGRTPFLRPLTEDGPEHRQAVERAMALVGINSLKERFFNELSGGEQQKAILAMALAQEPKVLFLDEPTVHLDIHHQMEILNTVRSLNHSGLTIMAALHDLNSAALYFQKLIVLKEGHIFAQGSPTQVLTEEIIAQVFSAKVRVEPHPSAHTPHIIILPP